MPIAGHVKFKSFTRLLAGLVIALALGAGLWIANQSAERAEEAEKEALETERENKKIADRLAKEQAERAAADAERRKLVAEREAARQQERMALEEAMGDARPVDKELLLDWKGKAIPSSKLKDVSRGRPYKINVYKDTGHTTVNRAKVDLDRDDKWDEKWTFESGGGVTRKSAPSDDENYSVEERWNGSAFVPAE